MLEGILFGCFLIVCCGYKIFGHELFRDPCEGNGSLRRPIMIYEEEEEDDYEKEFQEFINKKKKHFSKALVANSKSNSKKNRI